MTAHPIMFTVDVEGDWGGRETRALREVLPRFLELLECHGATATFFVVGELVSQVRAGLAPDGLHEVGSHGLTHTVLTGLTPEALAFEVEESKRVLEAEGYRVAGFRAPYFKSPRDLPRLLARAGYQYDASAGSIYPDPRRRRPGPRSWNTEPAIGRVSTGTLRDGVTPFSLTYLRLYDPLGLHLVSPRAELFYCHLHELLETSDGWQRIPRPLRRLHQRNSGARAWRILEDLMERFGSRFVSCREYFEALALGSAA
ncbi:MAG: polysaccharide deacetylase family protein [Myxococcota bacterium]